MSLVSIDFRALCRVAAFAAAVAIGLAPEDGSLRQGALDSGLLTEQHVFDVRMLDDWNLRRARILIAETSTLDASPRVPERDQIASERRHSRAHTHTDTGLVHHVEHIGETAVRLTEHAPQTIAFLSEIE